jgi:hypothetical protein
MSIVGYMHYQVVNDSDSILFFGLSMLSANNEHWQNSEDEPTLIVVIVSFDPITPRFDNDHGMIPLIARVLGLEVDSSILRSARENDMLFTIHEHGQADPVLVSVAGHGSHSNMQIADAGR